MKTGIIVEIHGGTAVILKPDGVFTERAAQPDWGVGNVVALTSAYTPKKIVFRRLSIVAACLVVLLVSGFSGYTMLYEPASIISIDINPSVELQLNRLGRVVSLTSYNEDGDALLAGLGLKGKPYDEAIPILLQSEAMLPYLSADSVLVFSVYSQDQGLVDYLVSQGEAVAASYPQLQVDFSNVGHSIVELAHQHGTTPGKMEALLELKELDPSIDISDYTHHSMSEIRQLINSHHGEGSAQVQSNGNGHGAGSGSTGGQGHHGE